MVVGSNASPFSNKINLDQSKDKNMLETITWQCCCNLANGRVNIMELRPRYKIQLHGLQKLVSWQTNVPQKNINKYSKQIFTQCFYYNFMFNCVKTQEFYEMLNCLCYVFSISVMFFFLDVITAKIFIGRLTEDNCLISKF